MGELVNQELDYPDNNYEGGLGVDEKKPELMWAVAGRSAVPELFNWVARKATEDLATIREYLAEYESVRKLAPLTDLMQVSGKEADIIYVEDYQPVLSFNHETETIVSTSVQVKRPDTRISLFWSLPDVENSSYAPTIDIDVDIVGEGETPGVGIDTSSQSLYIPTQNDQVQKTDFDLSVGIGDEDEDGWDDVRGKQMNIFIRRSPEDFEDARWQLHLVGVR